MAAVMIVLGFAGAMGNVELDTYLNERVPDGMLARVTSIGRLMSFSACALGPALGGILIGIYGGQPAVFSLFVMTLAFVAISIRVPTIVTPENTATRTADGGEVADAVDDRSEVASRSRASLQHSVA
jgi:MFS family permease